jgi:hypothetical protein
MAAVDWSRVHFTAQVSEAAAVIAECQIVLDVAPDTRVAYEVKIYEALAGGSQDRYFALGTRRDDPHGFHPVGGAATPEEALERCLADAGIHHRRLRKQAGESG